MAYEIRLGKLSPTMETGTVNRWLKKEGDKVSSGDTLAEVETDKASMPLEVFEEGTLLKILIKEGQTAPLNALLAIVGAPNEDISALIKGTEGAPEKTKRIERAPEKSAAPEKSMKQAGTAKIAAPPQTTAVAASGPVNSGRVKASPLARKIANERGIDLKMIKPSGPGGRIVQRDVPQKSAVAAPELAEVVQKGGEDIPLSNLRQTIARRLSQSKQTIPHWYLFSEIQMDRAMALRSELNDQAGEGGTKISVNDLIVKIAAAALSRHPEVNAAFNQTSIRRNGAINIAVAVATDDGLYTPVLRNVDRLNLGAISQSIKELAQKTREKKLKSEDLQGSGFTISNLGMYGVDHFFAIINPPEAAILAVGAVKPKPIVNAAGQVVAGQVMGLTLSCDHRVIDGTLGAKFMGTLKDLLEHPAKLLL